MNAKPDPGPFSLVIEGAGLVNGTEFSASGRGEGNSLTGDLDFEVTFSEVHEGTDPARICWPS